MIRSVAAPRPAAKDLTSGTTPMLRDGTAGLAYLLKDRLGGSVIDPQVVDALVTRRTRTATSPLATLTARELDVLREMAEGKTNSEIEQALHLSTSTIEKHVNSICGKLGLAEEPVHRRVAAVLTFLRDPPRP